MRPEKNCVNNELFVLSKFLLSTCNISKAAKISPAFISPRYIGNHWRTGGKNGFSYFSSASLTTGLANERPMNSSSP